MLYDWANSAFATTVLAGFFPIFFKTYWADHMDGPSSTALLGTAASAAVLFVFLVAVGLGTLADRRGWRRWLLGLFCLMGSGCTVALAFVPQHATTIALVMYLAGTVGYASGNVFYDALLPLVAPAHKLDDVSARAFALGYLGGGLLFALQVLLVQFHDRVGISAPTAVRISFATTGVWWAAFAVPLLVRVRERAAAERAGGAFAEMRESFSRLLNTLRSVRSHRDLFVFLVAFWFYGDGVQTIIKMATAYGTDIGLGRGHLIGALLMVQLIGLPSAWVYGVLARRLGRRPMILAAIAAYTGVVLLAWRMTRPWEFFVLAAVVGLFQGGIQAISRSLFASMTPPEHSAEFFGFYNLSAKFSTVAGPVLVGWTARLAGDSRAGILVLVALFAAGAALLMLVDPERGALRIREAR
jgi:UMF1 family MFS transporter